MKILDGINWFWGAIVMILSSIFGVYWYFFAAFLLLNVVDLASGIYKARTLGTESSNKGYKGIVKKLAYWVIIGIAFFLGYAFEDLGKIIGINLGFTYLIGWLTLATSIINEIRSILENFVEIGVNIPVWLIKGLEVANDKINNMAAGGGNNDGN